MEGVRGEAANPIVGEVSRETTQHLSAWPQGSTRVGQGLGKEKWGWKGPPLSCPVGKGWWGAGGRAMEGQKVWAQDMPLTSA